MLGKVEQEQVFLHMHREYIEVVNSGKLSNGICFIRLEYINDILVLLLDGEYAEHEMKNIVNKLK